MIPYMQVRSVVWLQSRHFNNAVRAQWLPCGCGEGKKKKKEVYYGMYNVVM